MPPYLLPSCYIRASCSDYYSWEFSPGFVREFDNFPYRDDNGAWVFLIGA